jgi:DNA-binding HxlR family transcriptional regulator
LVIKLSIMDTLHENPNHLNTIAKSASIISQLMLNMILKRVTESGDFAIIIKPVAAIDAYRWSEYVQLFCE